MPPKEDVARYRENRQDEINSAALYHTLAALEPQKQLSQIYERLAAVEERHARCWGRTTAWFPISVWSWEWRAPSSRGRRSWSPDWRGCSLVPARWPWESGSRCRVPANLTSASLLSRQRKSRRSRRRSSKSWP